MARDERLLERDLVLIDLRQPDRLIVRLSPDAAETEVGKEFGRLVQEQGLKAALEWRRAQFNE